MRRAAIFIGILLTALQPKASGAQPFPLMASNDPRIACGTIFSATATEDRNAVVVRIVDLVQPVDGTIKAYGAERVWTGHVSTSASAVLGPIASRFGRNFTQREDSFLVRAGGPIDGVEFDPSWSTCEFRAGVRKRSDADAPDVPRPAIVASNATPVEAAACAAPYVEAALVRAMAVDMPPMAAQQGITGIVRVQVALDDRGVATYARVWSSPSAILNSAALTAAKASAYRGAIFRCRPVPSGYEFAADFSQR